MESTLIKKIIDSPLGIPRSYFLKLTIFALINIFLINFLFLPFITRFTSDSQSYLETAKYFAGKIADNQFIWRFLKPVVPYLVALVSPIFDFKPAFLFINSLFYLATAFVVYKIIKLMFNNDRQALVGSIFYLSAYPVLEYGIGYMTDLAGWFFFVLCVYLTLIFLKKPSYKLALAGGLVLAIGFLAKEYATGGGVFFVICLLFIHKDSFANKIKYLLVYSISFLIPFGAWQLIVYMRWYYSYFSWYNLVYHDYSGISRFYSEFFRLVLKSLAATFLAGWIFVVAGLWRIKKISAENKKIFLALILPSFLFLFWPAASSRLFFIVGLLLCLLASWGMVSWSFLMKNKYLYLGALAVVVAGNYFWFIFDDRLRFILNNILKIHY